MAPCIYVSCVEKWKIRYIVLVTHFFKSKFFPTFIMFHLIRLTPLQFAFRLLDKAHHAPEMWRQNLLDELLGARLQELTETLGFSRVLGCPLL